MMGLLSPPAVIRLSSRESTPVRFAVAVGHKLERTSRVTCSDASAINRATEICGLFFIASASACFSERVIGAVELACGLAGAGPLGAMPGAVWPGICCGAGAAGRLCAVGTFIDAWVKPHTGNSNTVTAISTFLIFTRISRTPGSICARQRWKSPVMVVFVRDSSSFLCGWRRLFLTAMDPQVCRGNDENGNHH